MSDAPRSAERLAPARTPSHPSSRALEALAFEDEGIDGSSWASHVAECPRCRDEVASLRAGRAAFLVRRPPAAFMAELERAQAPGLWTRVQGWLRPGPALAAVMAGLLLAVVVGVGRLGPSTQVRLRGAAGLAVHVSRGGAPAAPHDGRALRAGDVLRFVVDAEADGYALVVNLDAEGRATLYVPPEGGRSVPVAAGRDRVLPGSIGLDDYVGEERVFLFWSERPLEAARVVGALEAAFARSQDGLRGVDGLGVEAEVFSVSITKAGGEGAR
jgi:hypothetical protein